MKSWGQNRMATIPYHADNSLFDRIERSRSDVADPKTINNRNLPLSGWLRLAEEDEQRVSSDDQQASDDQSQQLGRQRSPSQ